MLHVLTVVKVLSNSTFVWFVMFGESFLWASFSLANVRFATTRTIIVTSYTTLDLDKLGILSLLDQKYDSFLVLSGDTINRNI